MHVVLIPGAGGAGRWYWQAVLPLLEAAGHTAVAVDLRNGDPERGLAEYLEQAHAACASVEDVLVVGQSLGGFTAVMLAEHLVRSGTPPRGLVLLNAMVPLPGETPGEWWDAVGHADAIAGGARAGGWSDEFGVEEYFLHDIDPKTAEAGLAEQHDESEAVFASRCEVAAWPDVPTTVVAAIDDRFFPVAFQQQVALDRLGVEAVLVPGGHLAALSQPEALAQVLLSLGEDSLYVG